MDVGDRAPDFELPVVGGATPTLRLSSLRGRPVVLFFYPADETYGCTLEACAFRDEHAAFAAAGAVVVGISDDPPESHARFAERHRLPYLLASDAGGEVRRRYGVVARLGVLKGRVTFVVDGEGAIRLRFDSKLRFQGHAEAALALVRRLAETRPVTASRGS